MIQTVHLQFSIGGGDYTYGFAFYPFAFAFGVYRYPLPVRSVALWFGPFCMTKSVSVVASGDRVVP